MAGSIVPATSLVGELDAISVWSNAYPRPPLFPPLDVEADPTKKSGPVETGPDRELMELDQAWLAASFTPETNRPPVAIFVIAWSAAPSS